MANYRGDLGLFRAALDESGFTSLRAEYDTRMMFNDNSKDNTTRRLKLWNGWPVFEATQEKQEHLERELRKRFGDRILCMFFIKAPNRLGGHSLCIRLKV